MNVLRKMLLIVVSGMLVSLTGCGEKGHLFESDTFKIGINDAGKVTALIDKESGKNYLAADQSADFIAVNVNY